MLKRAKSVIIILLIFIATFPQTLKASINVDFGETFFGSIDAAGEVDTYIFSAVTNDTILVRMSRVSGSLWPALILHSPNGTELKSDYGYDVAEINSILVEVGNYTILVNDYWGDHTGNYSIFVQRFNNPGNVVHVSFGETVFASIDPAGEVDTYSFSATAGDVVLVRTSRVSGYLYPEVRLLSPNGNELKRDSSFGIARA